MNHFNLNIAFNSLTLVFGSLNKSLSNKFLGKLNGLPSIATQINLIDYLELVQNKTNLDNTLYVYLDFKTELGNLPALFSSKIPNGQLWVLSSKKLEEVNSNKIKTTWIDNSLEDEFLQKALRHIEKYIVSQPKGCSLNPIKLVKYNHPKVNKVTDSNVGVHKLADGSLFILPNNTKDHISLFLKSGQYYEPNTINIIKALIDREEESFHFVDVGANIGAISIPIANYLQNSKGHLKSQVTSLEAQRMVYYQLCGNIFINKLYNIKALSPVIGQVAGVCNVPLVNVFTATNIGATSLSADVRKMQGFLKEENLEFELREMKTIDSLNLPKANFIKIDVEGMELEVLLGAKIFLRESNYPPILFEAWNEKLRQFIEKREKLLNYLQLELGYDLSMVGGNMFLAQHPSRGNGINLA